MTDRETQTDGQANSAETSHPHPDGSARTDGGAVGTAAGVSRGFIDAFLLSTRQTALLGCSLLLLAGWMLGDGELTAALMAALAGLVLVSLVVPTEPSHGGPQ